MSQHALPPLPLPSGIIDKYVDCTAACGLVYHILQAGKPGNPLILFCHGYPELAFSWRKIMPAIAEAGYFCVAMDQRGYGRTMGWDTKPYHEVDMSQYSLPNHVRDLVCLVYRLGYTEAACIIGHDFGGVSSAMAALMRPDVFKATIQMSHPHHAPATPQLGDEQKKPKVDIQAELAALDPPRKHYKWYNSTAEAAEHWANPPQGLEKYLRGYFHLKSADWDKNDPRPLAEWSGKALEPMPEYYVMQKSDTFPQTIDKNMQGEDYHKTESWLSPNDLQVYVQEWSRTGFQGALNWYRRVTMDARDMYLFAGRRIEVPVTFISGKQDWGNYQQPGAFEGYEDEKSVKKGCFKGFTFVDHAGHWVQQEQPKVTIDAVLKFLKEIGGQ